MFSSTLVSLFVSRIMQKNYSVDFHKTRWKGGMWRRTDFAGYPDHVRLQLGLGWD